MSRPQEGLAESVQQLLRAYRRRLTLRTGVTGLLGVGCLGALLWRCSGSAMPRAGLMAVGGVGLLVVGGWALSRIRRERLAATHLPLDLDRALGLEARLLTAAELAQESNPPALYPVLLEETSQAIASASSRLPRVMDRWTAPSTAVLLLLLVYARAVRRPRRSRLSRGRPGLPHRRSHNRKRDQPPNSAKPIRGVISPLRQVNRASNNGAIRGPRASTAEPRRRRRRPKDRAAIATAARGNVKTARPTSRPSAELPPLTRVVEVRISKARISQRDHHKPHRPQPNTVAPGVSRRRKPPRQGHRCR